MAILINIAETKQNRKNLFKRETRECKLRILLKSNRLQYCIMFG